MLVRTRNIVFIIIILASFTAIATFYTRSSWKPSSPKLPIITSPEFDSCPTHLDWLDKLDITYPINYARRDIIVNPNPNTSRLSTTNIDAPLFPESQLVDLTSSPKVELQHCLAPLILDVPPFSLKPPDASHIIFGIATLVDRIEPTIRFLQRWLAHTNGHLLIVAEGPDDSPPDQGRMNELQSQMHDLGLRVTIVKPLSKEDTMPERYFSLIKLMYAHRDPSTKWITVIDDDTFFPSLPSLISKLDTFDPAQEWYIGALSEEWWPIVRYGMMAFGGAGIFLSLPLASILDTHYEDCKARSGAGAGDLRIRECIQWHSTTKLTQLPGLYQIDLHGDRSGLFESGRPVLSLHHWKEGWWDEQGFGTWFPMHAMHFVADVCSGECFLQRWRFAGDLVLSNGYTIAEYPRGAWRDLVGKGKEEWMEDTWLPAAEVEGSNNPGWDHYLGPLRPMLELETEKVQWRFLDAMKVDGGVRQFYLHLGVGGEMDSLYEIFWRGRGQGG